MEIKKLMETEVDSLLNALPQLMNVDRNELLQFTLSLFDKYEAVTNRRFGVM